MSFDLIKAERDRLLKQAGKRTTNPDQPYETGNERLPGIAAEWILFPWFLGILFAGAWLARMQ